MDYSLLVGLHFREDNKYEKMGLSPFLLRTGINLHILCFFVKYCLVALEIYEQVCCFLQESEILIKVRSSCVAIASLKQSYKIGTELNLAGMSLCNSTSVAFGHMALPNYL